MPDDMQASNGLSFSSFNAAVRVHGAILPVYGITETTNKDRTIISGYIECMPGDQLQIQHANELSMSEAQEIQDDLDISTYVDGEKIAGTVYPRELEDFYTSDDRLQEVKGHRDAPDRYQPIIFGQLPKEDDKKSKSKKKQNDDDDDDGKKVLDPAHVGTIQVRICRVKDVEETDRDYLYYMHLETPRLLKKGADVTNQIKFCPSLHGKKDKKRATFTLIDAPDKPWIMFEFKYRSRAVLQAKGFQLEPYPTASFIVPKSLKPDTTQSKSAGKKKSNKATTGSDSDELTPIESSDTETDSGRVISGSTPVKRESPWSPAASTTSSSTACPSSAGSTASATSSSRSASGSPSKKRNIKLEEDEEEVDQLKESSPPPLRPKKKKMKRSPSP